MSEKKSRFFIVNEFICDGKNELSPIWIETSKQAKELCDFLNKNEYTSETDKHNSIEDYFNEWGRNIEEITEKEKALLDLKETYTQMEQKIVDETDFKELYGRNNADVRKAHIKNELKDLVDRKNDLQLRIDYLKRRVEFIKELMRMQGILIDCGVIE